ncbi:MAG TPA: type 1 glutamine amidotransferase [Caulobacteraceae bacterium]
MKLGILETGAPPGGLEKEFGDYSAMFKHMLRDAGFTGAIETIDVVKNQFPATPEAFDAYLVTGSAAGVYDPEPWIAPLIGFLRSAKGRAKLVGVCFGHQVMAEAFGGKVIKSPKGWGLGLTDYAVEDVEPWMDPVASVALAASHQDQVVELPPGARIVAASDFTPYAALAYGDQPAISIQPHPEFAPEYASALIERRLETVLTEAQGRAAMATYTRPNDNARVGGWIRRFLERP